MGSSGPDVPQGINASPAKGNQENKRNDANAQRPNNPRRPRRNQNIRCFGCQGPHLARDCPVRNGLVHEQKIPLQALEGRPAAEAIAMLQPEAVNANAGDDPRIDVEVKAERKISREEKQDALRQNLRDKACSMLLTKDLSSQADRKVVMQSLIQLSRKEKAYVIFDCPSAEITTIFDDALKQAFRLRVRSGESMRVSVLQPMVYYSRLQSFKDGLMGNVATVRNRIVRTVGDDIAYLLALETSTPFNVYTCRQQNMYYYPAQFLRLVASLMFEKVLSFLVLFMFGNPNSPFVRDLICSAHTPDVFPIGVRISESFADCAFVSGLVGGIIYFIGIMIFEVVYEYRHGDGDPVEFALSTFCRAFFHMLDTLFALANLFYEIQVTRQGALGGNSNLRAPPWFDLIHQITWCVLCFHFVWNCYFVFWARTPWRCFNLINPVQDFAAVCLGDNDDAPSVKPTQCEYHCMRRDPECKPSFACRMFFGIKGIVPTVFSNCSHNEEISMDGRVGKKLPMHTSTATASSVLRAWKHLIRSVETLFQLVEGSAEPMGFEEWADSFPPNRRRELMQVKINTKDMPELVAKSFIKKEIAPKCEFDMSFKDPRFIQGCPLELSVAVGPTLRPWTKGIVRTIGPERLTVQEVLAGKHIFYTCGRSNDEIGLLFSEAIHLVGAVAPAGAEIVFWEDDQSRFDLHMTEGPFRFLKTMYRKKLPYKVARLLERKTSVGVSSLGTQYKIPFTMQSGWPDTSVGDTLVNAAMKTYIHGCGRPWISIICGDDSVTITTKDEIDRLGGPDGIVNKYAELGMEVEGVLSTDPLDVQFCSGKFYPVGDSYVLFPRVGRILSKIGCDMKRRGKTQQMEWARGITSTLEFYGRIDPVLGAAAASLRQQVGTGKELHDHEWEGRSSNVYERSTSWHDILVYYDHHYGFSEAQVKSAMDAASTCRFGEVISSPVLELMASLDL